MRWGSKSAYFGAALLLFVCQISNASDAVNRLLGQVLRPTIAELRQAFPQGLPNLDLYGQHAQTLQTIATDGPKTIAYIEKAFPGAVWVALGRDAFQVGDMLDAFYQSIGQTGRVVRINLSGGILQQAAQTNQLEQVLRDQGFDPKNIDGNPPFVFFDNTSYGPNSQSTIAVTTAYNAAISEGYLPADLIRKINILSTANNGHHAPPSEEIITTQEASAASFKRPHHAVPMPYAAGWMYGMEWHGTFSAPLIQDGQGRLIGTPGGANASNIRQAILWTQIYMMQVVSTPDFLARVQSEARQLGYEFPLEQKPGVPGISREERERLYYESLREELHALTSSLPEKPEQTTYLSSNGQAYLPWLEKVSHTSVVNSMSLLFVRELIMAKEAGKIGDRDVRRLLARAIGKMKLPDETLNAKFGELYQSSPLLQKVLSEKRAVFTESKQKDGSVVAQNFLLLEESLKCQSLLVAKAQ